MFLHPPSLFLSTRGRWTAGTVCELYPLTSLLRHSVCDAVNQLPVWSSSFFLSCLPLCRSYWWVDCQACGIYVQTLQLLSLPVLVFYVSKIPEPEQQLAAINWSIWYLVWSEPDRAVVKQAATDWWLILAINNVWRRCAFLQFRRRLKTKYSE